MGVISDALRANLRNLAQADAQMIRSLDQHLTATNRVIREMAEDVSVDVPAIAPAADLESRISAAIALLEANGYTITPAA